MATSVDWKIHIPHVMCCCEKLNALIKKYLQWLSCTYLNIILFKFYFLKFKFELQFCITVSALQLDQIQELTQNLKCILNLVLLLIL